MAAHRAHSFLHGNRIRWFSEIKRQDHKVSNRLLLFKSIKDHRLCASSVVKAKNVRRSPPEVIYLRSPSLAIYPTSYHSVLNLTPTSLRPQSALHAKIEPLPPSSPPSPGSNKPSLDQLLKVYDCLQKDLPRLFITTMDYSIYTQDVVLINNMLNKTTQGLFKYVQQVSLLRLLGHLKFAFVKLELISMSQDTQEGRITIKWRVIGISGLRVLLKFWKFKLWKWKQIMSHQEVWYDAISHFDVGADGLVFRHTIDKVEEDKERVDLQQSSKSPLMAKLALIAALLPRSELGQAVLCESLLQTTTITKGEEKAVSQQIHHNTQDSRLV